SSDSFSMHHVVTIRRVLTSLCLMAVLLAALHARTSVAYDFFSNEVLWPNGQTTFYTGLPGVSPSGTPWSTALSSAVQEWSGSTVLELTADPSYRDPCVKVDQRN